jgi:hypothetical protein
MNNPDQEYKVILWLEEQNILNKHTLKEFYKWNIHKLSNLYLGYQLSGLNIGPYFYIS